MTHGLLPVPLRVALPTLRIARFGERSVCLTSERIINFPLHAELCGVSRFSYFFWRVRIFLVLNSYDTLKSMTRTYHIRRYSFILHPFRDSFGIVTLNNWFHCIHFECSFTLLSFHWHGIYISVKVGVNFWRIRREIRRRLQKCVRKALENSCTDKYWKYIVAIILFVGWHYSPSNITLIIKFCP